MAAKTRRILIEERVLATGEVDFSSLAAEFGVSEMTIRRDLETLEAQGLVRRVVGGAIALVGKSTEPSFESRAAEAAVEKAHIAKAAVQLLHPNETVLLDSGSTVLAVAKEIKALNLGLTVVTPSILVALELSGVDKTTVLLTGGEVRPGELSLVGPEAEQSFGRYNCDAYVMGVAGIDAERGVSDYHRGEGTVKRAAIASVDRVIAVIDNSKLGRVQLMHVASLREIHTLVTDGSPDHPALVAAREAGVRVVCVPAPQERSTETA